MDLTIKDRFMNSILIAAKNSKAAFYLALIGVIVQFIHNVLAFAGTLKLFDSNQHILLLVGEWLLVILIGFFFAGALFYFTLKSGSVKLYESQNPKLLKENQIKKKSYDQKLWLFAIFDSLIDGYFWIYIVFLNSSIDNITDFTQSIVEKSILLVVIIPIIIMLPQTIRFYSGEINN